MVRYSILLVLYAIYGCYIAMEKSIEKLKEDKDGKIQYIVSTSCNIYGCYIAMEQSIKDLKEINEGKLQYIVSITCNV